MLLAYTMITSAEGKNSTWCVTYTTVFEANNPSKHSCKIQIIVNKFIE